MDLERARAGDSAFGVEGFTIRLDRGRAAIKEGLTEVAESSANRTVDQLIPHPEDESSEKRRIGILVEDRLLAEPGANLLREKAHLSVVKTTLDRVDVDFNPAEAVVEEFLERRDDVRKPSQTPLVVENQDESKEEVGDLAVEDPLEGGPTVGTLHDR